ncbi:hydrolase [Bacillus sp. SA1-12]|uniref:metal-dependent hydrolase n=1 Tax=Bacillus sp. SA1-12 TaxID=1455638 RepID=UPI000625A542|nr:metal-dependent hydrolase [Bacillus sp. SA1-12]KKI92460.1 hydrolase [Bacillus sp. SA1-12]
MNGTAHATIGAGVGFIAAQSVQAEPAGMMLLIGIGSVAGLMPDLDIDGKLTNKITFSHTLIRSVAQLISLMMIVYILLEETGTNRWVGVSIGAVIIIISSFIKQRHMLTVTGLGVFGGGLLLSEKWLILLGIYVIIASFVPHRSYTHSLLGIGYVAIIAYYLEVSLAIEGVFLACLLGYISHLLADMKILPFNKRGVKIFLPFSSKEF